MALITCPECGHQVSTTAQACPGCGYVFSNVKSESSISRSSPLAPVTKNSLLGGFLIAAGSFFVLCGLFMMIVFFPLGIIAIVGAVCCIASGSQSISGTRSCSCPYCRASGSLVCGKTTYKCRTCKKISYVKGDELIGSE